MATFLSGSTSRAEVLRAFRDNADYDLEGSLEKAKLFIQAGRILLSTPIRRTSSSSRGEEVEVEPRIIEERLKHAESWYHNRRSLGAGSRYSHVDVSRFREG